MTLEATGERLVPELQHGELVHAEHLVRYLLATELAGSRRVLDAACGEGYGTGLLAAAGARSVTGLDLDERTIAQARARYPGADFVVGDALQLPFDDDAFDLVVSFETIEHLRDPERLLDEFARVTRDDGLLVISTPNKHRYLVENEFHHRELAHEEFVALLSARFSSVAVLLQHNWLTSMVLGPSLAGESSGRDTRRVDFRKVAGIEPGGELYTVALCGSGVLPELPPLGVAASVDEAHELARRLVEAERTAEHWHRECERAQDEHRMASAALVRVYDSAWWRMTRPLRWAADRARRSRG
ncbi:MAG: class I SAM-dependent methyltransferase [Gammaproteobacteria bacterium]